MLQLGLEGFVVGMRIRHSKSEAIVLNKKSVEFPLWVREEFPLQVEKFKEFMILFTSGGRRTLTDRGGWEQTATDRTEKKYLLIFVELLH